MEYSLTSNNLVYFNESVNVLILILMEYSLTLICFNETVANSVS